MDELPELPFVSVIIPVHNGAHTLGECLTSLQSTTYSAWECVVVDDHSTDGSGAIAAAHGAELIANDSPVRGPAAARNRGAAAAKGGILLFLDADIAVRPDTVNSVVQHFLQDPQLAACFGSYDDKPRASNFLSQYKNLQHHYVHQTACEDASTFWAGCGAIRRSIFTKMGGFNSNYGRASVEDIELGYRLRRQGYRVQLIKELQVKHLKRWSAWGLLRSDVLDRALPWSRLIVREGSLPNDLNVKRSQRISALLTWGTLLALAVSLAAPPVGFVVLFYFLALLYLNRDFYTFLYAHRGMHFAIGGILWHLFYFLYSSATLGFVILETMGQRAFGQLRKHGASQKAPELE